MIAVIIPVYNAENYIAETVMSVLNQSYSMMKIKIILVDDGSTDRSSEICDKLTKINKTVSVIHQANAGVSSARNRGIKEVLSKYNEILDNCYICFLDADDEWHHDFIDETVIRSFSSKYDIIAFNHYEANSNMTKMRLITNRYKNVELTGGKDAIWAHEKRHIGCMFFNAAFLKKYDILFPVGLKYNEDEIFKVYTECLAKKILLCEKAMYIYRLHGASAVHNLDKNITNRYCQWMAAWIDADITLQSKYNVKTSFGHKFAAMYFVEMHIVLVESLISFRKLKASYDRDNEYFSNYMLFSETDFYLICKKMLHYLETI